MQMVMTVGFMNRWPLDSEQDGVCMREFVFTNLLQIVILKFTKRLFLFVCVVKDTWRPTTL